MKNTFTKILAVLGTVLVWLPILAPFLFGAISLVTTGQFRFDYLIPAEIFPVELIGAGLLLWASLRAHVWRGLIAVSLGAAVFLPMVGQVIASFSGLASGRIEPSGVWWILVSTIFVLFFLSLVVLGIGGIMLLRELFRKP